MAQQWTHWATASEIPPTGTPAAVLEEFGLSSDDIRRARRWLIVTGVLAIGAGIVALAVPAIVSVATSIFFGWVLVFAGAVMAAHAWSRRHMPRGISRLLGALLTIVAGLYILIFPLSGTVTLTFVLVVWFVGLGLFELAAAYVERAVRGAWLFALSGVVSIVLGVLIGVNLPSSAVWAIGLLVALELVLWGVRALVTAASLGRLSRSAR